MAEEQSLKKIEEAFLTIFFSVNNYQLLDSTKKIQLTHYAYLFFKNKIHWNTQGIIGSATNNNIYDRDSIVSSTCFFTI